MEKVDIVEETLELFDEEVNKALERQATWGRTTWGRDKIKDLVSKVRFRVLQDMIRKINKMP